MHDQSPTPGADQSAKSNGVQLCRTQRPGAVYQYGGRFIPGRILQRAHRAQRGVWKIHSKCFN